MGVRFAFNFRGPCFQAQASCDHVVISAPILTVGPAPNNPPRGSITISNCTMFHCRLSTPFNRNPNNWFMSTSQSVNLQVTVEKTQIRLSKAPIISLRGYLHVTYIAAAVDASYCPLVSHFRLKFTFFTTLIIWIANRIQLEGDAF